MDILKGQLVKKWVEAVDRLCDSDPSYDWNAACRAVAHGLEDEETVTSEKISAAAKEYWGNDDSRDYSVTVGDLDDVKSRISGDAGLSEDDERGIRLMRPLRFK